MISLILQCLFSELESPIEIRIEMLFNQSQNLEIQVFFLQLLFGYYEIIGYVMKIFMTRQLFDICRWDVVVCQSLNHSFTTKHFLSKATFYSVLFLVFSFPCFCIKSSTEVITANLEFFREEAKEQAIAHLLMYEPSVKVLKVK